MKFMRQATPQSRSNSETEVDRLTNNSSETIRESYSLGQLIPDKDHSITYNVRRLAGDSLTSQSPFYKFWNSTIYSRRYTYCYPSIFYPLTYQKHIGQGKMGGAIHSSPILLYIHVQSYFTFHPMLENHWRSAFHSFEILFHDTQATLASARSLDFPSMLCNRMNTTNINLTSPSLMGRAPSSGSSGLAVSAIFGGPCSGMAVETVAYRPTAPLLLWLQHPSNNWGENTITISQQSCVLQTFSSKNQNVKASFIENDVWACQQATQSTVSPCPDVIGGHFHHLSFVSCVWCLNILIGYCKQWAVI